MARDGWRLLGDYRFDPTTGLWRHRDGPVEPPLRLRDVSYDADGAMTYPRHDDRPTSPSSRAYLDEARRILAAAAAARLLARQDAPDARTSTPCAGSSCPRAASRPRP